MKENELHSTGASNEEIDVKLIWNGPVWADGLAAKQVPRHPDIIQVTTVDGAKLTLKVGEVVQVMQHHLSREELNTRSCKA